MGMPRLMAAGRHTLLTQSLVLAVALSATTAPCPVVEKSAAGFTLRLPSTFRQAIHQAVPGFQSWTLADYEGDIRKFYSFTMRQAPWAVIGDFDGDGWCDLVIDGHDGSKDYRLVVWGGERLRVQLLPTSEARRQEKARRIAGKGAGGGRESVLEYYGPGHIETNFNDSSKELFTDAFNDYDWERGGALYFWKDGRFEQFITSD